MYYAQMYSALHAGIILQRLIARALYWAWLVKVLSGLLQACLTVCPGSACCLCCPLILGRLFFEPQKPRDNRNHDNTTLRQVCKTLLQKSEYEYGLDHVGGIRCCESNKSRMKTGSLQARTAKWAFCTKTRFTFLGSPFR